MWVSDEGTSLYTHDFYPLELIAGEGTIEGWYLPIAVEVIRSLVWTNISWSNISTSIVNQSTCAIVDVVDRESTRPQMFFKRGLGDHNYIDAGAEVVIRNVDAHVFLRPTSNTATNIRAHRRDMEHLVEEVQRVVRQNRDNASGYSFIKVDGIVPLDIEDDPRISPPYLETLIKVACRSVREELS